MDASPGCFCHLVEALFDSGHFQHLQIYPGSALFVSFAISDNSDSACYRCCWLVFVDLSVWVASDSKELRPSRWVHLGPYPIGSNVSDA